MIELSGVGRATLYRNFPDRFALLEALYEESFALLEQLTAEYHGDRSGGFFRAIEAAVAQLTSYALLSEYWRSAPTGGEARMRARERVERMFAPLLAKAQAEGECRNNMTSGDVPHIRRKPKMITPEFPNSSHPAFVAAGYEELV
ncbi:hypothetical protein [Sphingobium yanoikuyae]|uniref:hypothetical protein n=1 Tax=Sphingobium yanoikuyae TaxID=13690 RepID=UPI003C704FF4